MRLPAQAYPVIRNRSMASVAGVEPSSVCSICESVVETVVEKVGCGWWGLIEFEAECNAALDIETEGAGAAICAAAGAALKYACSQGMSEPAKYVAQKACGVVC